MEINRLELRILLLILLIQRDLCPFFPKSLWRNKKGRKTHTLVGWLDSNTSHCWPFIGVQQPLQDCFGSPSNTQICNLLIHMPWSWKCFSFIKNLSEHPYASCTDSGFCQSYPLHFISLQQPRWGIATVRYQIHSTDDLAAWRCKIFYYFHNYSVKKLL